MLSELQPIRLFPVEDFNPPVYDLTIRAHHFMFPYVRATFARRRNPSRLATELVSNLMVAREQAEENSGYHADVLGVTEEDTDRFQKGLADFLQQIRDLPDRAFVKLGLQPDGICRSCNVGRHCLSTNYRSLNPPHCVVEAEEMSLRRIHAELERAGKRSEDFFHCSTVHTLYNLDGQALNQAVEGVPETIIFDSLVIKAEILRKIC